jgi:hypothetical protein
MSYYDRFRPLATPGTSERKLYTVSGGLSALAGAFVGTPKRVERKTA